MEKENGEPSTTITLDTATRYEAPDSIVSVRNGWYQLRQEPGDPSYFSDKYTPDFTRRFYVFHQPDVTDHVIDSIVIGYGKEGEEVYRQMYFHLLPKGQDSLELLSSQKIGLTVGFIFKNQVVCFDKLRYEYRGSVFPLRLATEDEDVLRRIKQTYNR